MNLEYLFEKRSTIGNINCIDNDIWNSKVMRNIKRNRE